VITATGQAAGQAHVWVARYAVCSLPPGHPRVPYCVVMVDWRGRDERGADRWAVCRMGECLNARGEWGYEPRASERDDAWLAAHYFDLGKALELAKQAAPALAAELG
jgi:hypothetical protein